MATVVLMTKPSDTPPDPPPHPEGVIFEDDFDDQADWATNKPLLAANDDKKWPNTYTGVYAPPTGWTSFRCTYCRRPSRGYVRGDTFVISSTGTDTGTGKCLAASYEVGTSSDGQTYPYIGNDYDGGGLDKWLGLDGYEELYIQYKACFPLTYIMGHASQQKLIRICSFPKDLNDPVVLASNPNPQDADASRPVWIVDLKGFNWAGTIYKFFGSYVRQAPDYASIDTNMRDGGGNIIRYPDNGAWHTFKFHVKMNTYSAGAWNADGVAGFYIDGAKSWEQTNVTWKKAGSVEAGYSHGWNWLICFDNAALNPSGYPRLPGEDLVYTYYVDDFVVSTEDITT